MHELKKRHGSVMAFVQKHRLRWSSASPSSNVPFRNPSDYKILYNDWPYGLDPEIIHLVVWTKFLLEDDPTTDDLTTRARQEIEGFVQGTFCNADGIPREQLMWFKNWRSLKSIHALGECTKLFANDRASAQLTPAEHFHVMLYKPSAEFVDRITQGDQPTSATVED
jgi:hypothetical protein